MKGLGGSIVVVLVSSACGGDTPDAGADQRQTVVELPATPNRDLDLLFVIQDSPGMLEKQYPLRDSLPTFFDRLQQVPGGMPNLHLGVVSTDMGTKASGSAISAPAIGQINNGGCSARGKNGNLQLGQAAGDLANGAVFISDIEQTDGTRLKNYTGALTNVFAKMIILGAGGCGFEQPLAAMRAALELNPANAGFLRPEAMLGVVFLADEDDCSAKSTALFSPDSAQLGPLRSFRCTRFGVTCEHGGKTPDEMNLVGEKSGCGANAGSEIIDGTAPYRDFLTGLKADPRDIVVAGIVAPGGPIAVELRSAPGGGSTESALTHACSWQNQGYTMVADPAVRLRRFAERFPDRSVSTTICQPDFSDNVVQIANVFRRAMGNPCVEDRLADAAPGTAGEQLDCVVEDLAGSAAAPTPVASCDDSAGARPCWQLEADAAACPTAPPPSWKLVVQRDAPPDPATVTRMRCRVEP